METLRNRLEKDLVRAKEKSKEAQEELELYEQYASTLPEELLACCRMQISYKEAIHLHGECETMKDALRIILELPLLPMVKQKKTFTSFIQKDHEAEDFDLEHEELIGPFVINYSRTVGYGTEKKFICFIPGPGRPVKLFLKVKQHKSMIVDLDTEINAWRKREVKRSDLRNHHTGLLVKWAAGSTEYFGDFTEYFDPCTAGEIIQEYDFNGDRPNEE